MPTATLNLERIAELVRHVADVGPRVPPTSVAIALGFEIVESRRLPPGHRAVSSRGSRLIMVEPCDYQPRRELSVAHELFEQFCPPVDYDPANERFFQRGGAALQLPKETFRQSIFGCEWDLARLRRAWRHVSWEVLARRMAEMFPRRVCAAGWQDDPLIPAWRTSEGVTVAEQRAIERACLRRRGKAIVEDGRVTAIAWSLTGRGADFRAVSLALWR